MKLTDATYVKLRDEIFSAAYKPNELITERQIAERFGISKLTAGEVLHRLCSEGHLTSYPRSGYMVTILSPKEMRQLARVRLQLEKLCIETICEECSGDEIRSLRTMIVEQPMDDISITERNRRFHLKLAELTHDRFLFTILQDILGTMSRVEQPIEHSLMDSWQNEHKHIVDALAERDASKALEAIERDIGQML